MMAKKGEDKIRLEVTPEFAAYAPGGQETCRATSTIIAPFYEPTSRSELDLVAVIDRSGSMSGTNIKLVKETLAFIIDQLKEQDRFCLVSYSTDVTVDIPLTHMTKKEKKSAKRIIEELKTTHLTALCDGLITGMQQIMTRIGDKAKVASVLLLTDGQANVGPSSMESILDAMKNPMAYESSSRPNMAYGMHQGSSHPNMPNSKPRQRFNPFGKVPFEGTIYTFGFGSDHDARLLEAISQATEGGYYYIDSAEKIPGSFADCLGGLLSVVGQNMEMSLACTNGCSMANVHAKNPAKMTDGNTKCVVQLGDLLSEEERDVVLELTLPATGEEASDWTVVSAKLTYFNVISSVMEDVQCDLKVQRKQESSQVPNKSVLIQNIRISALRSLNEAQELGEAGNLDKARDVLKAAVASIEESELTEHKLVKYLLADMKGILESYSSQEIFVGVGSKMYANAYQSNLQQRSLTSEDNAYANFCQVATKEAFRKI